MLNDLEDPEGMDFVIIDIKREAAEEELESVPIAEERFDEERFDKLYWAAFLGDLDKFMQLGGIRTASACLPEKFAKAYNVDGRTLLHAVIEGARPFYDTGTTVSTTSDYAKIADILLRSGSDANAPAIAPTKDILHRQWPSDGPSLGESPLEFLSRARIEEMPPFFGSTLLNLSIADVFEKHLNVEFNKHACCEFTEFGKDMRILLYSVINKPRADELIKAKLNDDQHDYQAWGDSKKSM